MCPIAGFQAAALGSHKLAISEQFTRIKGDLGSESKRFCNEVNVLLQVS